MTPSLVAVTLLIYCLSAIWPKISRLSSVESQYADDTTLLHGRNDTDVDLEDEFDNVKRWASKDNRMILNLLKMMHCINLLTFYLLTCLLTYLNRGVCLMFALLVEIVDKSSYFNLTI